MKSSLKQLDYRTEYYKIVIKELLKSLDVDISKLTFVRGTEYQLSKEFTMDVYKLNSQVN